MESDVYIHIDDDEYFVFILATINDTNVSWDDDWYHMHIESCLNALHTFGEVVKYVIFDYVLGEPQWFMCIGELGELCALMKFGEHMKMCTWRYLLFLVILVHLVILINDVYLGENNEMWVICMWFDDLFGDDDFFIYTLK